MKKWWPALLLPALIIFALFLAIFGEDDSDKIESKSETIVMTEATESRISRKSKETTTKKEFSAEDILQGYDLACRRSNGHETVYYKVFDFDGGIETEFSVVYKRRTTELKHVVVVDTLMIGDVDGDRWNEIHPYDDETIKLAHERKNVDGIDKVIQYDYKGKESNNYIVTDLDEAVNFLREGLKSHDAWNVERLLTPQQH